jgi:putative FmdB family regulatory protein
MPSYEYECENCGNRISIMRSVNAQETEYDCPECEATLTRIWNIPGVMFKGGGWGGQ